MLARPTALVAAAFLAAAPAHATQPNHDADCLPPHAKLVRATPEIIVYRTRHGASTVYGACWRASGRRMRIWATDLAISGRYVAYVEAACIVGGDCSGSIHLADVKARRNLRTIELPSAPYGVGARLVLAPTGALGYMDFDYHYDAKGNLGYTPEIRSVDATGAHVLDRADDIDISSLALGGMTMYWRKGGVGRSAQLA